MFNFSTVVQAPCYSNSDTRLKNSR